MASKKPELKAHGEPHAPEPQTPEKKGKPFARGKGAVDEGRRGFLRSVSGRHGAERNETTEEQPSGRADMGRRKFLGIVAGGAAAAALGIKGKKARADETAEATRVASAETPNARGHAEPSVGGVPGQASLNGRSVEITNTEPIPVSSEEFKRDYAYMFDNRNATVVVLPTPGTHTYDAMDTTVGDWEIRIVRDVGSSQCIYLKNSALNYETELDGLDGGKAVLLPFPESEYAKGPMLAIVFSYMSVMYFYNKVTQEVTVDIVSHQNFFGAPPRIGTDVFQNEPYIVLAPDGSLTSDSDMKPGTRFLQYALLATTMSRNGGGPAPSGAIFERRD
jgi:hypothetical protein